MNDTEEVFQFTGPEDGDSEPGDGGAGFSHGYEHAGVGLGVAADEDQRHPAKPRKAVRGTAEEGWVDVHIPSPVRLGSAGRLPNQKVVIYHLFPNTAHPASIPRPTVMDTKSALLSPLEFRMKRQKQDFTRP